MVIQRLQNLYLFLAILLMGLFCFLPCAELYVHNSIIDFGVMKAGASYNWGTFSLSLVLELLLVVTLALFKKPKVQKKLAITSACLLVCYITAMILLFYALGTRTVTATYNIIATFPIITLILDILAINRISKDIKLLASAYRLR